MPRWPQARISSLRSARNFWKASSADMGPAFLVEARHYRKDWPQRHREHGTKQCGNEGTKQGKMNFLKSLEEFLRLRADVSGAQPIPDNDQRDGPGEYQSGDGVNFWRDAAAETSPDFEGQGVIATYEEEGDGDFIHGEGEDEQAGGDEREFQVGKGDAPEGLPGRGAEVERGFFLRAIEFLQAGEKFGGGDGDERGAVAEKNGEQTELHSGEDGEHEQGGAGDDPGKNQWEKNQAAEEGFAGEAGAI